MKKVILLSILGIVLFILPCRAQIEETLPSHDDSTRVIVEKGRERIIEKLIEKDYLQIKEIYHYLEDQTLEKENTPFDYTEYLYLNLLLEDWEMLAEYMKGYNESEHIVPYMVRDPLKDLLIDNVVESADSLLIKINHAAMDEEAKSVMELFTRLTKSNTPDNDYYSSLDQHERKYKGSAYNDFINNYLPAKKVKQAYSFSLGSGMIFPTGRLEEFFSQRQSFYASIDFNYKRLFGAFYAQAAGLKLEVPFILDLEAEQINYLEGDIFNYQDFGIKGGYLLVRSNRFHIGPYATINGIMLKTTDFDFWERLSQKIEDDENWEYKIIESFCFGGGMHTEIKLFETHKANKNATVIDNYFSIKADAGYNYITDHDIKLFKGNTWYYTVALVFGIGTF